MADSLPKDLSEWGSLAAAAGFQNWEQVVSDFVQERSSAARELHEFLHSRSKSKPEHSSTTANSAALSKSGDSKPQTQNTPEPAQAHQSCDGDAALSICPTPKKRINIGGTSAKDGWCIFNALKLPHVDVVGLSTDLSHWETGSVEEVYSSHCFEHLGYQKELLTSLREVARILVPGGSFKCSVPNLEVLCDLYLKTPADDPGFSRFAIMRMIYGGQMDNYDFHKVGFDFWTMRAFMLEAGFESVVQVPQLDVFQDTSCLAWNGTPISLNVIAYKSKTKAACARY